MYILPSKLSAASSILFSPKIPYHQPTSHITIALFSFKTTSPTYPAHKARRRSFLFFFFPPAPQLPPREIARGRVTMNDFSPGSRAWCRSSTYSHAGLHTFTRQQQQHTHTRARVNHRCSAALPPRLKSCQQQLAAPAARARARKKQELSAHISLWLQLAGPCAPAAERERDSRKGRGAALCSAIYNEARCLFFFLYRGLGGGEGYMQLGCKLCCERESGVCAGIFGLD